MTKYSALRLSTVVIWLIGVRLILPDSEKLHGLIISLTAIAAFFLHVVTTRQEERERVAPSVPEATNAEIDVEFELNRKNWKYEVS